MQNLEFVFEVNQTTHSVDNLLIRTGLSVLHTVYGTDDNTEQFKLHTSTAHKRKRIIIIRKLYKEDSSIDILTQ